MAANPAMDLESMRDLNEGMHTLSAEPEGVTYAETVAGDVPAIWCIPEGAAHDRVITWAHAGGYVVGSMFSHLKIAAHLAKAVGARALVFNYRRAPEAPPPAPVECGVGVYRWLLDNGIEPGHIAVV